MYINGELTKLLLLMGNFRGKKRLKFLVKLIKKLGISVTSVDTFYLLFFAPVIKYFLFSAGELIQVKHEELLIPNEGENIL